MEIKIGDKILTSDEGSDEFTYRHFIVKIDFANDKMITFTDKDLPPYMTDFLMAYMAVMQRLTDIVVHFNLDPERKEVKNFKPADRGRITEFVYLTDKVLDTMKEED